MWLICHIHVCTGIRSKVGPGSIIKGIYASSKRVITGYGSTLYIGIARFLYSPHTLGNSVLTFSFKSILLLMTIQYRTCQNKTVYEIFH